MTRRVYFIKALGIDSPVKIGCSTMPRVRLSSFVPWSPYPLEIVAEIEGDFQLEKRFHAKFFADHCHSEWFRWSAELGSTIEAVADGTFDVATLPPPLNLKRAGKPKRKWSEAQRRSAELGRRARALAAHTGRLPLGYGDEAKAAFLSDPIAHGTPREEVLRKDALDAAARFRRAAQTYLEMAEEREGSAA